MKKTIKQLKNIISRQLSETNSALYQKDGNWLFECQEADKYNAIKIIQDAGWEIIDQESLSGIVFIIIK